jgi:hypothetical protein
VQVKLNGKVCFKNEEPPFEFAYAQVENELHEHHVIDAVAGGIAG